ncbi:MAG: TetR/AcrR family transcriptional regulator [Ferrimicrobium sp.]
MSTYKPKGTLNHRGRPLDGSRDVALRNATLELLAEIGYDQLTIDAVAARVHSSKTTIYRRWPGKAELVVDALNSLKGSLAVTDTGSLQGDLKTIAQGFSGTASRFDTQLMIGLITARARDAELRQVFRERLIDPRTAILKQVFERAVARGEVAKDRNLDLLVILLPALMIQHLLTFGEVFDDHFAERVISDVILPLATAPTNSSTRLRTRH